MRRLAFCFALLTLATAGLRADTLTLANGDTLAGELVHADAAHCAFKTPQAGTVTVAWKDVKALRTLKPFVIVTADGRAHQGLLAFNGGALLLSSPTGGPGDMVPLSSVRAVVEAKAYQDALRQRALWENWHGALSGGFSDVAATQSSISLTGLVDLQRPIPPLAGLDRHSNTLFHLQGTYGRLTQPGLPAEKTSIVNARLEQDETVSPRFFALASAGLDHNYSQGLQLQQAYGGGLGWTAIQSPLTQLAIKADLHYTRQQFLAAPVTDFAASNFSETLQRKFGKLVWNENFTATPAWGNSSAYEMSGLTAWTLPVYHALGLNISLVDNYLGDPQPGFRKNSLQFSTGIQVTLP